MSKTAKSWTTFAAPAVLVIVGLTMLVLSWRKWPDPLVDFGRELYVPWQLSQGQVLYRDIAYFNGPLSPYFNALIFKIFGAGLMSLAWVNIAILAVFTFLAYRLLKFISSRFAATVACVCFLVVFALAQYTNTGNYNFICPYSHELTHGLVLSFIAVYSLSRYLIKPRTIFIGLVGLCLGLILLTKVEVFLAAAPALFVGLILIFLQERPPAARLLKLLVFFIVGLVIPSTCFVLYFSSRIPLARAIGSVFAGYGLLSSSDLTGQRFYRAVAGLDAPLENLLTMLRVAGWYSLVLAAAVVLDWVVGRFEKYRTVNRWISLPPAVVAILWAGFCLDWFGALRPLPLFMLVIIIGLIIALRRAGQDQQKRKQLSISLVLAILGLTLLAKIVLNVRAYHYGFALAVPAAMVLIAAIVDWLPSVCNRLFRAAESSQGRGIIYRALILLLLVVTLIWHFNASRKMFAPRTEQIGQGPDMFLAAPWPKAQAVNQALQTIAERIPPDKTFVVLPEGVMLNYLTRRANSTGHISFMPPDLTIFGRENILTALQKNPPDYVIRVPKGLREYGYRDFSDCAPQLAHFLETNYSRKRIIGQSRRTTPNGAYVYNIYLRERVAQ